MDDKSNAIAVWSLDHTIARFVCGQLAGNVDAARPDMGLHIAALDHDSIPCRLLCTRRSDESASTKNTHQQQASHAWPLTVAEAYVRGNDLVASYRPSDEWPYSPQLYWQAKTLESVEGALGSMSHMVSVQTHLLDTHPKIQVASQVPSDELRFITIGEDGGAKVEPVTQEGTVAPSESMYCVLWRLPAAPVSYVEVVSAQDVRQIEFRSGPQDSWMVQWHLFAEFLEKGVIRRARVHAALLPRQNDVELALECCAAAQQCPLPLTT